MLPGHWKKLIGEIPFNIVDDIIFVDDFSTDNTIEIGRKLGIEHIIVMIEIKAMEEIKNRVTIRHWTSALILS